MSEFKEGDCIHVEKFGDLFLLETPYLIRGEWWAMARLWSVPSENWHHRPAVYNWKTATPADRPKPPEGPFWSDSFA